MDLLKSIKRGFTLALLLFSVQLLAEDASDNEFDEKPWAENDVQLPSFPEKENLIPFQVGVMDGTKYLVDSNSLSVGSDDVVRYTLLVISASGAQNISYEGMHCGANERRLYASGRSDNTWSKARGARWVRVQGSSNNLYVELYSNYFCAFGVAVRNADDARRVLRNGGQNSSGRH